MYSARVVVLGAIGPLWIRELFCCVSALEWDTYVGVLEEIGNFSYFRAMVGEDCPFFAFISIFVLIMAPFLCCICTFRYCMSFSGKLLFCAIDCISFHSVGCLSFVSGTRCVLDTWFRYAAVSCSMG